MTLLVTQEEALRQLRLSSAAISPEELADVLFKAEQASDIVADYLKAPVAAVAPLDRRVARPAARPSPRAVGWLEDWGWGPYWPGSWWGPPPGPPPPEPRITAPLTEATCPVLLKGAILTILTALYDGRTPGDELLSGPVRDILERYRDPALA